MFQQVSIANCQVKIWSAHQDADKMLCQPANYQDMMWWGLLGVNCWQSPLVKDSYGEDDEEDKWWHWTLKFKAYSITFQSRKAGLSKQNKWGKWDGPIAETKATGGWRWIRWIWRGWRIQRRGRGRSAREWPNRTLALFGRCITFKHSVSKGKHEQS